MSRDGLLFMLLIFYVSLNYVTAEEQEHPFDLLIFTQRWPISVCKDWKGHNPSKTCNLPKSEDTWTVHGVWPTKLHTVGPLFCNKSWHFDPEAVKPIEATLSQLWTDVELQNSDIYSFWSHEWVKHGTCAAQLEPLNSEYKYFSTGLNWIEKYSMLKILSAANIVPSNDKGYSISDINKAIKDVLHVDAAIECRKIEGKSWIFEIRTCFNKTLHLMNCDGIIGTTLAGNIEGKIDGYITNCNLNEPILYPEDLKRYSDDTLENFEFIINPDLEIQKCFHERPPAKKYLVELYRLVNWLQWLTL